MVKKPCCARTLPWPWHMPQVVGDAPSAAPEPLQVSQATEVGTCTSTWRPWIGVFQGYFEIVTKIGAPVGLLAAPASVRRRP